MELFETQRPNTRVDAIGPEIGDIHDDGSKDDDDGNNERQHDEHDGVQDGDDSIEIMVLLQKPLDLMSINVKARWDKSIVYDAAIHENGK